MVHIVWAQRHLDGSSLFQELRDFVDVVIVGFVLYLLKSNNKEALGLVNDGESTASSL
jgi:hypothetical protein